MRDHRVPLPCTASGFFALRIPLLPLDVLLEWSKGLTAVHAAPHAQADALKRDRATLRERMRDWLMDPIVREALFVASPVLDENLSAWLDSPDSDAGLKVERTLVRYLSRMAGRATPFGLFASLEVGQIENQSRFDIAGRHQVRRHTRLDMDYITAMVAHFVAQPEVRAGLKYEPNSSLYRVAGRWRYLELHQKDKERLYNLVAVSPTPYLEATLERARGGARLDELAKALVAEDSELSVEDAQGYVEMLAREQLLIPSWAPPLSGPEPMTYLLAQSRELPSLASFHERASAATEMLARMDEQPLGIAPEAYRAVAHGLATLPTPVELPRLFQVDLIRPANEASLSSLVVEETLRGVELLQRLSPRTTEELALARFRRQFVERYEERSIPLAEALDEESGIGFPLVSKPGASTGPLLAGFAFPMEQQDARIRWEARWSHLQQLLEQSYRAGALTLELSSADLKSMEAREPVQLPDAFSALATLIAPSAEAVNQGQFQLFLDNAHGPSGAITLGRFCHGDAALDAAVREHMRAEEALRPDAIFAEVIHLPQGRMGNIICRPAHRAHDLVFFGKSGAAQQLSLADLDVSVRGERIVLCSRSLGREVIPRLTNVHNYSVYGLSPYRFLCLMQNQHQRGVIFQWGPVGQNSFLPRVTHGRLVFALAQWNLGPGTLKEWKQAEGAELFDAVQRYREQVRLPRWVYFKDFDNRLPIDLDNVLSVETLVHLVRGRHRATLEEMFPGPENLCMKSAEGSYVHEFIIPFVQKESAAPPLAAPPPAPLVKSTTSQTSFKRRFPPGSEWLYVKIYTGTATADRLLRTHLLEALRKVLSTGKVDRWFFIRFRDPHPHLRLRFHGMPEALHGEVWPVVHSACAAIMGEESGWRIQLDTYEREVERYGGPIGIELSEEVFSEDSATVLDLLRAYPGDAGADLRWRLALKGMDVLLDDLGMSLEEKLTVVGRLHANFSKEFRVRKNFTQQLGARFRKERSALESLLSLTAHSAQAPWKTGLVLLERRSVRLRALAERLRYAEQQGQLTLSLSHMADSFLHMHVNRMLPADQRAQEFILYDMLLRLYRSLQARRKQG